MSSQGSGYHGALADLKESKGNDNTTFSRILVTGASGGIGAEIALIVAQNNRKIGLHYHNNSTSVERTANLIKFNGGSSIALKADVTQADQITRVVEEFVEWAGGIDVLINNAGSMIKRATLDDMDLDLWQETYKLNVESTFLFTKAVLPYMKNQEHGGSIVNMSSIAAVTGGSVATAHYASAKAAVSCFTLAAAKELAPYNIRVNAVAPGFIETPFHDHVTSSETMENFKNITPLKRLGTARDIAEAVQFLTSNSSSFITGTVLDVNGGLLMRS